MLATAGLRLAVSGPAVISGHLPVLLQALTDDIEREACYGSFAGLEQLFHALFVVLDERLAEQRDFLQKFLYRSFHYLFDDVRGLAGFRGLGRAMVRSFCTSSAGTFDAAS